MNRISSRSTAFYKKVFPIFWFGGLALFSTSLVLKQDVGDEHWEFIFIPLVMAVIGFVIMKKVVWDLLDEVHDGGDFLLVRKGGDEERVPLTNIMNINASTNMNPPRVTLRLAKPGKFGPEISFSPPARFSFNPFAKHPVVEDLIVRVDRARRNHV